MPVKFILNVFIGVERPAHDGWYHSVWDPGLYNGREGAEWQHASISLCFLIVDVMQSAASSPCLPDFALKWAVSINCEPE